MKVHQIYINGSWKDSNSGKYQEVINPTTEDIVCKISLANKEDVDEAVSAARKAFPSWNSLSPRERAGYLQEIAKGIRDRKDDLIDVIVEELGSARSYVEYAQVLRSADEIEASIQSLEDVNFEEDIKNARVVKEGVGVVAAINPWNFPLNQIQRKMTPALLAGNTIVVKPASQTPSAAIILAEIVDKAGLGKGVFNLLTGTGSGLGDYLAGHPGVDLISFTGSTEVGKGLYEKAKDQVKRMVLELGGKSPMILLPGGDLDLAVESSIDSLANNSGQVCSALSRLIVPKESLGQVEEKAEEYFKSLKLGDPNEEDTVIGPLVSKDQYDTVLSYIEKGKEEGADLLIGGRPVDRKGYFIEPTIFTGVKNDMTIAQEEIFGPVLSIISYETVEEAIEIANDVVYGLSGAVVGPEDEAVEVALRLKTGDVYINDAESNSFAPFGGYKESGLGREVGKYGIENYLEIKSIFR